MKRDCKISYVYVSQNNRNRIHKNVINYTRLNCLFNSMKMKKQYVTQCNIYICQITWKRNVDP